MARNEKECGKLRSRFDPVPVFNLLSNDGALSGCSLMRKKLFIVSCILVLGPVLELGLLIGICQLVQTLRIYSRVPSTLSGHVTDMGKPVAGAVLTFVLLEKRELVPGLPYGPYYTSERRRAVTTGADGAYEIRWKHQVLYLESIQQSGFSALEMKRSWNWSGGNRTVTLDYDLDFKWRARG
jgi:hypothetical protein